MSAYLLVEYEEDEEQRPEDTSFIGGVPRLPADVELPHCAFCGALQSFIFQVAFPSDHVWAGYTLAFFYCTNCEYPDDHILIPMLNKREGKTLDIPANFFEEQQMHLRILVFPTEQGQPRPDYKPRVRFFRWNMLPVTDDYPDFAGDMARPCLNRIGGHPLWIRYENAPTTYAGAVPMHFLMQIKDGFWFKTLPDAPPQMADEQIDGLSSLKGEYILFLLSGVYFFGPPDPDQRLVYVVIQS